MSQILKAATVGTMIIILTLFDLSTGCEMADAGSEMPVSQSPEEQEHTLEGDPFAGVDDFSSDFDAAAQAVSDQPSGGRKFRTDLHGYLESRNRLRLTDGEWLSTRQRLWLELDTSFHPSSGVRGGTDTKIGAATFDDDFGVGVGAPYRFFASGAIDVDPSAADLSDDTDPARLYVEEAFITIDQPEWDLMIGQKIHRTGTGDGINPMDLVNPVDYRDPMANGRSDSRLPIPLAFASFQLPHHGIVQEAVFEAIFIPLARVNKLNASGSPWESIGLAAIRQQAAEGTLILEGQQEPDRYFEEAEFGIRLAATFSGWDVGLVGFSGYKDSPVFTAYTVQTDGEETLSSTEDVLSITPDHPKFSAIGLTFAKGFERSTLRGELAWKPDLPLTAANLGTTNGFLRRSVTEGVVGIDRTFGVNLYTNVQYFFTITDNASRTTCDTFAHGMTYEVNDKFFNDDLKSGIRGIVSFSHEGWTLETYAEYQPLDDWLLSLSMLLLEGPDDGNYGTYDDNDALTLRLRYSF